MKTFEDQLTELIQEHLTALTTREEILLAMEIQVMAMKEEIDSEDPE